MKILVTGGCGFIGYNICNYLLDRNYEVIAFDNLSRKNVEHNLRFLINRKNFTWIKGDVTNRKDFYLLNNHFIDAIIHLAANPGVPFSLSNPRDDFNINTVGTLNILDYSRNNGKVPIIFASTNKVYGNLIHKLPVNESGTRYNTDWSIAEDFSIDGNSHSPYGCSKLAADIYMQEYSSSYDIPTVINRMSCIYGHHQYGKEEQGWITWFIIAKIKNMPITIFGNGKQVRDCLFGEDLASLYELQIREIDKFKGKVFNIGGSKENTISLLELIKLLDEKYSQYPELKYKFEDWRQADQKVYISNIDKISEYWKPTTSIEEGVDKTFKWVESYHEYFEV